MKRRWTAATIGIIGILVVWAAPISAQMGVGILNPDSSAVLHLESVSPPRGFLPPRLTTAQRDAIVHPAVGLTIYNTELNALQYFNGECWLSAYQQNCSDCYFSMSLSDSSGTIDRTQSDSLAVDVWIEQTAGTPQAVGVNVFGVLPTGIEATVWGNPVASTGTARIVFRTTPFTPSGTFVIPIQAVCGPSMRTILFTLTLEPCFTVAISNSTHNVDLAQRLWQEHFGGAAQDTPVCVVGIIAPGVEVGSTTAQTPAFTTGQLPAGSLVGIVNKGLIIGKGGRGGDAWAPFASPPLTGAGENGGHALFLTERTILFNEGYIFGGGGGGNAMAFRFDLPSIPVIGTISLGIGAGGGGGAGGGEGGNAATVIQYYSPGQNGTTGLFGVPGQGGVLITPIPISFVTITPNIYGGNGGAYGFPGTQGTFTVTVTAVIPPFGIPLNLGTFGVPVSPPPAGNAGYAAKRNGHPLFGLPDAPNYQTQFVKGPVGD
ncbi:MAG: hypothetical protein RMM53_03260 [Bacteroidia bacterium]|nr:hypothetical protein [Bacteroidia bacterium]MDW8333217.1 hypothetical protein [Bacteroidia bacterium]